MVTAVIRKPGQDRQFYVFSGIKYATIELASNFNDKLVDGPSFVREQWSTFKEANWGSADAVVQVPGANSFYVFVGGNYFRGTIDPNSLKDTMQYSGVKPLELEWKPLVDVGFDTVDAAIPDPSNDDILFFFRGTKSLKYSYKGKKVVAGPKPISSYWPAIGKAGFDSIDAIFKTPNGDSYHVFKGDQYARISWNGGWDTLEVDRKITRENWPSLSWI
ncbi:Hemopexin/matrixin [Penicillium viridicatum]|nr:Hemopexin/matrixin [Penicillium viridicatum]